MDTSSLENMGLTHNESSLYVALLRAGESTALALSKTAGIKRPTVYLGLEALMSKGLAERRSRGFKTSFAPCSPERLYSILAERERGLDGTYPELMALFKLKPRSAMRQFEGVEGIKTAYDIILSEMRSGEEYLAIADQMHWHSLDNTWFDAYLERKARRGVRSRVILTETSEARRFLMMQHVWKLQAKLIPTSTNLVGDIVLSPSQALIHNFDIPISVTLFEHPDIVRNYREIFSLVWNMLPDAC